MITSGSMIAGKYKVIRKIGSGGMSEVYLAEDLILRHTWALKVVVSGSTQQEKWKEGQILSEAMLMKRFDHPGFPRIVDLFCENNVTCIVMDYVEGETLDQLIRRAGPQKEAVVIIWARQLCDMLLYLHKFSPPVIYRDLKPANIIYRSSGRLCLIDFGIAASAADGKKMRTGTPGFAAPEQMRDGICDVRTDIYALGMTLYYLLTGLDPRDDVFQNAGQDKSGILPAAVPYSAGMQEIIRMCTEQLPQARYQNCDELMRDLLHPARPEVRQRRREIRRRMLAGTAIAGVLLIAAGVIFQRGVREFTEEEIYAARLDPEPSFSAEEKERSYLEAIELQPEQREGFTHLLELYETEMEFGERESRQLLQQFYESRETLLAEQTEAEELLCRIGKLYFFRYRGGDGSVRERILRAEPFFLEWKQRFQDSERTDGACLHEICSFYKTYTAASAQMREPGYDELVHMLTAIRALLDLLETYSGSDQAAVKLMTLREMAGFLYTWRFSFYAAGTKEEALQELMDKIRRMTGSVETLRADTLQEKQLLESDCDAFKEGIRIAWASP